MLLLDPQEKYARAIVGATTEPDDDWPRKTHAVCAVYSREKVIEILMEEDGMDYEGAAEFFDFNIAGAWMGEGTPTFVD